MGIKSGRITLETFSEIDNVMGGTNRVDGKSTKERVLTSVRNREGGKEWQE